MTTIDHQQTAIWAIAAALHGDACPADPVTVAIFEEDNV